MARGLNIHAIARGCIAALQPEESALLVQSTGYENDLGVIELAYAEAAHVYMQVQSFSNDELTNMEETSRTEILRKAYLFSETPAGLVPAGIIRPLARNGDVLRRSDGTWWTVISVMEDFSASGWMCIGIQLQMEIPEAAQARADEWDEAQKAKRAVYD